MSRREFFSIKAAAFFRMLMKKDKPSPLQSTSLARSLYHGELYRKLTVHRSNASSTRGTVSIVNYRCRCGGKNKQEETKYKRKKKMKRKENDAGESPMGNIIFLTTAIGGRPILAMNFDGRPPRLYRS